MPLLAACLAAVSVQQAAQAQILPAGPITGNIVWNDTANWSGGIITNTTTGSFSGNPTFQFSAPYTVSSGSIFLTDFPNQARRSTTFAASTGTQTITFNANTGFRGGLNNYDTASQFASSLILNLSSGAVTFNFPTVRSSFINSQITGNGTLRIVGDANRTDSTVTLGNSTNNWTGGLINEATIQLTATNSLPSGAGYGSFINDGQLFVGDNRTIRVNSLSGTLPGNGVASRAVVMIQPNPNFSTSTFIVNSLVSSTYAGWLQTSELNRQRGTLNFTKEGTETLTLTGSGFYYGQARVNAGTLDIRSIFDAGVAGTISAVSGTVNTPASMAGIRVGMRFFYNNGDTVAATGVYVTATTDSTFSTSASLVAGRPFVMGFGDPLGISTSAATNLVLNGGSLRYSGSTGSTNRRFGIGTGGGGIIADGTTGALSFTGGGTIGFNGQTGARVFTLSGSNTGANTLTTALADNGGQTALVKSGVGRWVLGGIHTYTGSTSIDAGGLLVNGTLGNTAVTVNSAGLLGGSGRIDGSVSVLSGGTFSPGTSPGVLTLGSSLTLAGTTLMEIDGTTRGTQYDGADVGGALTYGGALSIVFNSSLTSAFADQTEFNFFDFASQSGSFTSISTPDNGAYYGGLTFTPSGTKWIATKTSGTQTQTLEFTESTGTLVIVPEPLMLGLLGVGSGVAVLGLRRLRRQKADGAGVTDNAS